MSDADSDFTLNLIIKGLEKVYYDALYLLRIAPVTKLLRLSPYLFECIKSLPFNN
jgi:hypothetical protein